LGHSSCSAGFASNLFTHRPPRGALFFFAAAEDQIDIGNELHRRSPRSELRRIDAVRPQPVNDAAADIFTSRHQVSSGGGVNCGGEGSRTTNPETVRETGSVVGRFAEG
jgi:hypothetical protein